MKFINKMRKKTKGFTLVEIIVVLVILAILAAFTIPTMLGFVNDANAKAHVAQAREIYVAAQAAATEIVATGSTTDVSNLSSDLSGSIDTDGSVRVTNPTMKKMLGSGSDLPIKATWLTVVDVVNDITRGKVTSVTLTIGETVTTIKPGDVTATN